MTATRLAAPAPTRTASPALREASSARAIRAVVAASAPATVAQTHTTNTSAATFEANSAATDHEAPNPSAIAAAAIPPAAAVITRITASLEGFAGPAGVFVMSVSVCRSSTVGRPCAEGACGYVSWVGAASSPPSPSARGIARPRTISARSIGRPVNGSGTVARAVASSYERSGTALHFLNWDVEVPPDSVDAKVQDGWVTLTGDVSYQFESDAAYDDVASMYGVFGITNE